VYILDQILFLLFYYYLELVEIVSFSFTGLIILILKFVDKC